MKDFCILSDFDGTITKKDGLYSFIEKYAVGDWQYIENEWENGKINSKECLTKEFELIPDLNAELIDNFAKSVEIDEYFADFYKKIICEQNIDFYIISDGIDYFIRRILANYNLNNISIISNNGKFINNRFIITFPNENSECINNAGTCKCAALNNFKKSYSKVFYIGDGVSDYCVADKSDVLFAKSKLSLYCESNNIKYTKYFNFNDIIKSLC